MAFEIKEEVGSKPVFDKNKKSKTGKTKNKNKGSKTNQ